MLGVVLARRRDLLLVCFDEKQARVLALPAGFLHYLLLSLLALVIVVSLQAVGLLLVVAMLITPGATARLWTDSFDRMLAVAVATAVASSLAGILISYHIAGSTAACIVLAQAVLFLLSLAVSRWRGGRAGRARREDRRVRIGRQQSTFRPFRPWRGRKSQSCSADWHGFVCDDSGGDAPGVFDHGAGFVLRRFGRLPPAGDATIISLMVNVTYPAYILNAVMVSPALREPGNVFPPVFWGAAFVLVGHAVRLAGGAAVRTAARQRAADICLGDIGAELRLSCRFR